MFPESRILTRSRCSRAMKQTVGDQCLVVCRPGYEPTADVISCEKTATNRVYWKGVKQIKCKPLESGCEAADSIRRSATAIRIKATTKYPEERLHFITRYDTSKKLPQFSAYVHTKDNNANTTDTISTLDDHKYLENSCDKLQDKQWQRSDYERVDYVPKPLMPTNAFRYSAVAQSLVHSMSNIAPQDPFTSRGPWMTLENRTLEILRNRPGIVINGICPESIDGGRQQKRNESIPVPKCFWSIVCVPLGTGVTTGVFYAENTHPISQLEKQSRVDQTRQYRDQRFISKLLGTDMYKNVWIDTYNAFKNVNKGIKNFIYKCAETDKNGEDAIDFWDKVINDTDDGQLEWQTKFTYGLETNQAERRAQTPRRRTRDDQADSNDDTIDDSRSRR